MLVDPTVSHGRRDCPTVAPLTPTRYPIDVGLLSVVEVEPQDNGVGVAPDGLAAAIGADWRRVERGRPSAVSQTRKKSLGAAEAGEGDGGSGAGVTLAWAGRPCRDDTCRRSVRGDAGNGTLAHGRS